MNAIAQRPLRAACVAYLSGTENHGDETLHWLLAELLAPEIELVGMEEEADLALLGGGTLINQSEWLIDSFAAALDRCGQGAVLGTGVGDPRFWGNHFDRWNALLGRCLRVGVRGPRSQKLLRENGFRDARLVGDPYLVLDPPLRRDPVPGRITVNLGSTNDALWGGRDSDLLDFLAALCLQLGQADCHFRWVSVWSHDLPLLEELRRRAAPDSPSVIDARNDTLRAFAAIAGSELFIGEKLHANAMAAVAGVPFLALEYQPKVADFAESLGLESYCISTAERDCDRLRYLVHEMRANRERLAARLTKTRKQLRRNFLDELQALKLGLRRAVPAGRREA